jgi:hypothetical protein
MNETDYFDDDADDALDAVMLARLAGGNAPEMDIDAYRLLVGAVAPPTDRQIKAFADYVAAAHSWYKHLPMQPPGVDFHFYIDPNAGMDFLVHASGEVTARARTPDTESFHHAWMTTADYCARFGCLAFSCAAGSSVFGTDLVDEETVLVDTNTLHPVLQVERASAMRPPKQILDMGTCSLTALVHPRATASLVAMRLASPMRNRSIAPPVKDEIWDAIKRLWDRQQDMTVDEEDRIEALAANPEWAALIQQQRARHRQTMIEAMRRMRSGVFPHGNS